MQNVVRLLARAARREVCNRLLVSWCIGFSGVFATLTVLLILDRVFTFTLPWRQLVLIGALAGFCLPMLWVLIRWPSRMRIAQVIDERGKLRSTMSTAIAISDQDDPWSHAMRQHAVELSRGVSLRSTMPVRAPSQWRTPLVSALVLLVVFFAMPQFDLLGREARASEQIQQQEEIAEAQSQAEKARETIESTLDSLGLDDDQQAQSEANDPNKPESPEAIRQAALRELTELGERLQSKRSGAEGLAFDAMEQQLRRLRNTGGGPLEGMVESLQQGDISAAREQLQSIQEGLDTESLDASQQELLQQQLESLANQMNKLASQQQQLEEMLRKQGIDPSMLKNPQALREMIQQSSSMSPQQKEQLLKQMDGMQNMQGLLNKMAQASNDAAKSLQQQKNAQQSQQGQQGQQGQGQQQGGQSTKQAMQQLDDALAQMEMLEQEMEMLDAAQQQVWGQMSDLAGDLGEDGGAGSVDMLQLWDRRGKGSQRGAGGAPDGPSQKSQYSLTKQRAIGQEHEGPSIATRYVQGEQIRGESTAAFREVVQASAEKAAEAIESQRIPREYHDVIKHYFGQLESKVETESHADEPKEDTTPPNETDEDPDQER